MFALLFFATLIVPTIWLWLRIKWSLEERRYKSLTVASELSCISVNSNRGRRAPPRLRTFVGYFSHRTAVAGFLFVCWWVMHLAMPLALR